MSQKAGRDGLKSTIVDAAGRIKRSFLTAIVKDYVDDNIRFNPIRGIKKNTGTNVLEINRCTPEYFANRNASAGANSFMPVVSTIWDEFLKTSLTDGKNTHKITTSAEQITALDILGLEITEDGTVKTKII